MNAFQTDREQVAAALTAAGVEAVSLDRGQAPPLVLVGMPSGTGKGNAGQWETTVPITVVGNPPGDTVNAGWMLEQVQTILLTLGMAAFRPVTYGDEQLPAMQLTYTRNVPNPNC
jgi:hypothetical protein